MGARLKICLLVIVFQYWIKALLLTWTGARKKVCYTNWNGHMKFSRKTLNMKSLKVLIFLKVNQITIYWTIKFEHIFSSCVLGLLVWSVMKKHCFKFVMIVKFFWRSFPFLQVFSLEKKMRIFILRLMLEHWNSKCTKSCSKWLFGKSFLEKKKIFLRMIICPAKLDVTLNKLIQDTGHFLAALCTE